MANYYYMIRAKDGGILENGTSSSKHHIYQRFAQMQEYHEKTTPWCCPLTLDIEEK